MSSYVDGMLKQHSFFITFVDDAAYYGLMVYVYDQIGVNRWFLPVAEMMARNPVVLQCLRYGMMFASMNELRQWLEGMGITTDLSSYLDSLINMVSRR